MPSASLGKGLGSLLTNKIAILLFFIIIAVITFCIYNYKKSVHENFDNEKAPVTVGIVKSIKNLTDLIYTTKDLAIFDYEALDAKDTACRIINEPSNIPEKQDTDEVGCGWYYIDNPDVPSFSALGGKDGPVNPEQKAKAYGGKWYFAHPDMIEAQVKEDKKRCSRIRACNTADLYPNKCSFCKDVGGGVPTIFNGDKFCPKGDPAFKCYTSPSTGDAFNGQLVSNRQIGTVNMTTGDYVLSFDITLKSINGNWTNIIRVGSGTGNCCGTGQRAPAIWFWPGSTRFHCRIGDTGAEGNWGLDPPQLVTLNKKCSFKIEASGNQVKITVDGVTSTATQPNSRPIGNLKIWLSDPWHEAPNATIENLFFVADGQTVFGAPRLFNKIDHCGKPENDICFPVGGKLTKKCLLYLAKAAGMKDSGMLMKILYHTSSFTTPGSSNYSNLTKVLSTLKDGEGLNWNIEYFGGGSCKREDLIKFYTEVYKIVTFGKSSSTRGAATWLAIGGDFDFDKCDSTVTGPYDLDFIQRQFIKNGGTEEGEDYPTAEDLPKYNNMTCDKIRSNFSQMCQTIIQASGGQQGAGTCGKPGAATDVIATSITRCLGGKNMIGNWDFTKGSLTDLKGRFKSQVMGSVSIDIFSGRKAAKFSGPNNYINISGGINTYKFKSITMMINTLNIQGPYPRLWEFSNQPLGGSWCGDSIFGTYGPDGNVAMYAAQNCNWIPSIWNNTGALTKNTWHHLAFVFNKSMTDASIYVNGKKTGSWSIPNTNLLKKAYTNMWIMQSEERFNKETAVAWFRIFDYSLAEDDINKDMNSWSSAPSLPNPVVFLNASSYSGSGAWNDSSSHGRNATIEDGRAVKNAAGNGIVLDGRTSWTFPNIGVGNKWSLSVWYKNIGSFSPSCCILTQKYIPGKVNLSISNLNNDGKSMVVGYIGAGGPNVNGYAGGYVGGNNIISYLTNSKWVNIQATWDGTTMSTFINGSLVGSVSGQGNSSIDGGLPYRIGRRWDSAQYVTGEIGEVRIFGEVLSSSQVSILYNTTSTSYN